MKASRGIRVFSKRLGLRALAIGPFYARMTTPLLRYLPITFDVAGGHVAVAGNGAAALRKLELLSRTRARLTLFSSDPALTASGVTHIRAYPTADDLSEVTLLFVATGDEQGDERLAAIARAARVPVNVVDRPHLSTFAMPALVERGSLTVAIASDGLAPVLAQRVRALIDAVLPRTFANLGELARSVRSQVLCRLPANAARRRFWWRVLDGEAGTTALAGRLDEARDLALHELDALAAEPLRGKVYLVGAGPGSEDLLTLRAQRLLLSADVIVHDMDVPENVVAMGRRDAIRFPATQTDVIALLIRLGREGRSVVRLSAGTPRGEEAAALRHAGVDLEIVPGVTVATTAASSLAA